jgi:glycosyltransferase involved in cell wall biosynthesis
LLPFGFPIVINDGSSDQTSAFSKLAGARVIDCDENRGYDNALNMGFSEAKRLGFNYVITFDADGQHDTFSLKKFIDALDVDWDVVVGKRANYQRFSELIFGKICKYLWNISDPLCGMKGYSMNLYDELGYFDSYQSIGTELLLYALSHNRAVKEVPIKEVERHGQSRFGSFFIGNFKIIRAMIFGLARYCNYLIIRKFIKCKK